ncbi:hypothetical protein HYH02_007064 [Chlamydomonas schloesseri]|uniref:SnoaL-like domain-containing protein n=1 Tax=Chlamydomonas schloesseri TaxID=2026947 RepID=A0A835WIJ8_9CHLO|nr:hypothetical protein HYH02_007064 [Chlamydomonas schloesseri]|eukprot:KAG2448037.1 hypothetical protein HYH02_007064 [Chlamydomonas schloesseri]
MAFLATTSRNVMARGTSSAPKRPAAATLPLSRMSGFVVRASAAEPARRDVLKGVASGLVAVSLAAAVPAPAVATAGAAATIKEAYGAFGKFAATGDYGPLESYMADDISWVSNVNSAAGGFKGKGKADVKRFFTWVSSVNAVTKFQPIKFIEEGSSVAVLVNMAGSGKVTGKPYDTIMSHFFVVENGQVTDFREFVSPDLDAVMGKTPFPKA